MPLNQQTTLQDLNQKRLIELLRKYDMDNNGVIDQAELDEFKKKMGKDAWGSQMNLQGIKDINELQNLLNSYDTNQDGKWDLNEITKFANYATHYIPKETEIGRKIVGQRLVDQQVNILGEGNVIRGKDLGSKTDYVPQQHTSYETITVQVPVKEKPRYIYNEVPVEVIREVVTERIEYVPKYKEVIKPVIKEVPVEEIVYVEKPYRVEKIVEKVIERPFERTKENLIQKHQKNMKTKEITKVVKKEVPVIQEVIKTVKVPFTVEKIVINPVYVDRKVPVPCKAERQKEDIVTESIGEVVDLGSRTVNQNEKPKSKPLEPVHVDTRFVDEVDTRKRPTVRPVVNNSPGRVLDKGPGPATILRDNNQGNYTPGNQVNNFTPGAQRGNNVQDILNQNNNYARH